MTAVEIKLESVQRDSSLYETPPTHRESRSEESRNEAFSLESSPCSVELQGEAAEASIPASQTEYDGEVPLPSVKALMSKFSVSHEDDDLEGGSLRRVSISLNSAGAFTFDQDIVFNCQQLESL